ncbi:DUF4338 domain-containing protein [Dehalococcoidia bacterium]|nr:DUF4338 domain-containing protein [Dehalococcoidia bacterium]
MDTGCLPLSNSVSILVTLYLHACLLFGSAPWKCTPPDDFIDWNADTRKANLHPLANSMQFLILPSVRVTHLASYILR